MNIRLYMFKTYCLSFYGSELWDNQIGCYKALNSLKIGYHKAVKRLLGLPFKSSSHEACISADLLTLEHLLSVKMLCFGYSVINSHSPCIRSLKSYFITKSNWMKKFRILTRSKYDIDNMLEGDRDAMHSRISFVYLREPRYQGYVSSNRVSNDIAQP